MDIVTNSFCVVRPFQSSRFTRLVLTAARLQRGNMLANGTWAIISGNQAVTYGGMAVSCQMGGLPYDDPDGGVMLSMPLF
ncbi:hypothetical protein A0H81_02855 [Grifola frondosa]|uniref:Uncharacterized protein n=1 Tax=Grifola frondosa TaxID=5627 RepID=A0A1C7MM47_GRIFR|nr:hypothetical protein A0H81_02855 [Grifola frondosa]